MLYRSSHQTKLTINLLSFLNARKLSVSWEDVVKFSASASPITRQDLVSDRLANDSVIWRLKHEFILQELFSLALRK